MNATKGAGAFLRKNKSGVLMLTSLVGFGATVVLVAIGQKKADKIMDERNQTYISDAANITNEDLAEGELPEPKEEVWNPPSARETFDLTWKCYLPAVATGGITVASIIAGYRVSKKEVATLMGTIGFLTANRNQLEQAVREKYGDAAVEELKEKLRLGKTETKIVQVCAEETGHGDLLCCERHFGRWFRGDEDWVKAGCAEFSKRFQEGNYEAYNDLYILWGLTTTTTGDRWGYAYTDKCYDLNLVNEFGIPFKFTRVFDHKRMEDVLYIELASPNGYDWPMYPTEYWTEY